MQKKIKKKLAYRAFLNALTNSFKTLHISKRDFYRPNCLHRHQQIC